MSSAGSGAGAGGADVPFHIDPLATVTIRDDVSAVADDIVANRRHFHAHPELSFQEVKTAKYIADKLRSYGNIAVTTGVGRTGVVGLLKGAHDGPCIALRADMDALPIKEATGLPFASTNDGVHHACGHDGHMAILLGAARVLSTWVDRLHGSVKFMFQPAEEGHHGAPAMIRDGVLESPHVDQVYGLHLWNWDKLGTVGVKAGPVMASSDRFTVTIKGHGGHGAAPQGTSDAVVAASALVMQLQTIVSRSLDPTQGGVVTVGSIHGGKAYNAICDHVELVGTTRAYFPAARDTIEARLGEMARSVAATYGAEAEVVYERGYPPTINSAPECDVVAAAARPVVGGGCHAPYSTMAAEDFSYFLNERPGCFFFVGSAPAVGVEVPHHKPSFTVNEDALAIGASVFVQLIENTLCWTGTSAAS